LGLGLSAKLPAKELYERASPGVMSPKSQIIREVLSRTVHHGIEATQLQGVRYPKRRQYHEQSIAAAWPQTEASGRIVA
jgi:hypothetical protein